MEIMTSERKLAARLHTPLEFKQMKIGEHVVNYAVGGKGPALLLIHGGNLGWGQWYANIDGLAEHFTVYALDLPGGGRSTKVDFSKMDFEKDLVDVVDTFINNLPIETTDVIGSSNGGWITLKLALQNHPKIRKIIVANSVGFSDYATIPDRIMGIYPLARFLSRTVLKPLRTNPNIEKILRNVFHDQKLPLPREFIDYYYETMASSHNVLFISRMVGRERKHLSLRNSLRSIKKPTLIIWGEKDALMPLGRNQHIFGEIPGAITQLIPEAGHIPSLEKPEEFNSAVINFLLPI